jgi:hypothetical protein
MNKILLFFDNRSSSEIEILWFFICFINGVFVWKTVIQNGRICIYCIIVEGQDTSSKIATCQILYLKTPPIQNRASNKIDDPQYHRKKKPKAS